MASSSSSDPWLSPAPTPHYAFARDDETLTRALRISLSPDSASASASASAAAAAPEPVFVLPASAGADPRGPNPVPVRFAPAGRIRKRKRRAPRLSPTTYISADPANFRAMVQLVTGIRFDPGSGSDRAGFEQSFLLPPALDSPAFSPLDRAGSDRALAADVSLGPGSVDGPGSVFEGFDPTLCFPTLESWSV